MKNKITTVCTAVLSECGQYRYALKREWDAKKPKVMFVMLNPSTADHKDNDATIRRCIGFAKSWGFGGIIVGNLFAYRSTQPDQLLTCTDPIGPANMLTLQELYTECASVVCAWGNGSIVDKIMKMHPNYRPLQNFKMTDLYYLKLSNSGHPWHPLYLHGDTVPEAYTVSPPYYN